MTRNEERAVAIALTVGLVWTGLWLRLIGMQEMLVIAALNALVFGSVELTSKES